MSVRPAKTQISLGIRPVWSVFAVRMKKKTLGPLATIERTAKTLIRLDRCPGWSKSSLITVFTKVRRTAGHVKQKFPRSDKYFRNAGHVVRWNFRAETGVKIVIFVQRIVCEPISKRSTNQNICYKKAWPAGYRCTVFKNMLIPLFTVIRSGTILFVMGFRDFKFQQQQISGKSDLH